MRLADRPRCHALHSAHQADPVNAAMRGLTVRASAANTDNVTPGSQLARDAVAQHQVIFDVEMFMATPSTSGHPACGIRTTEPSNLPGADTQFDSIGAPSYCFVPCEERTSQVCRPLGLRRVEACSAANDKVHGPRVRRNSQCDRRQYSRVGALHQSRIGSDNLVSSFQLLGRKSSGPLELKIRDPRRFKVNSRQSHLPMESLLLRRLIPSMARPQALRATSSERLPYDLVHQSQSIAAGMDHLQQAVVHSASKRVKK